MQLPFLKYEEQKSICPTFKKNPDMVVEERKKLKKTNLKVPLFTFDLLL